MTHHFHDRLNKHPQARLSSGEPLNFQERYPCPICRYGQLEGLFMVDAFSCTFCRHIFTIDATHQLLRLEDHAQPLRWRWQGGRWTFERSVGSESLRLLVVLGAVFVLTPTLLVWLAYHTFPPLPSQRGAFIPPLWTGLVFMSHSAILGWLCLEHYQFPFYVTARLYLRRFLAQLP